MTQQQKHEYKHKIDLSMFSPSDGFPEPLDPAKSANRILAYALELEERVAKMQVAGDAMAAWLENEVDDAPEADTDAQEALREMLEAWRNA